MVNVFVTGMGVVSALGATLHDNHQLLRAGRTGLGKPRFFESLYADTFPFGEVNISNETLLKETGLVNESGLTRTDLLAYKAFQEAVGHASLTSNELMDKGTAFISASTVGGMCLTDQLYQDANKLNDSKEFLQSYPAVAHSLRIIRSYGIKGFTDTLNTACSSSLNALILGCRLIQAGKAQRAIVGGVDSLAKYTVNGFNALAILSTQPCRSFDANRDGLNLGEAGAYIVLEAENVLHQKPTYGQVVGFGNACDAYHASALSDDAVGVIASIQRALCKAGIEPSLIDFIHTHGTATPNNDLVESRGMKTVFKSKMPAFISTKPYTGHTLGAAGVVGAIYTLLSMHNQELYPSLHFTQPTEEGLVPNQVYQSKAIQYALTSAFGFGGNCSSVVFKRC